MRQRRAFVCHVLIGASLIAASMSVDASAKDARDRAAKYIGRFETGDPGWKARMEALVTVVKAGPVAVPALVEALKNNSPSVREFAAQALSVIADPRAKPALVRALDDPDLGVRIYALRALATLGRVDLSDPARTFPREGTSAWMPSYVESALANQETAGGEIKRRALLGYDLATLDSARLGQVAPEFSLTDTSGTVYRLSQFRGKKIVILEFEDGSG